MPSAKNVATVEVLTQQLTQAKALILADYRGLTVADFQKLRQAISQTGGLVSVAKNTLIKLALKNQGLEPALQGPTALILSLKEAIAPIKALVDFAKNHALNLPTPKAGLLNDKVLTAEDIKSLAALPSREQLITQLLGQIQAPIYGLVTVLQANLRSLVYALSAVKPKKEVN